MSDSTTAMQRYNAAFSGDQYNSVGERLASNLNAERDDASVVDFMVTLQNAALELCGHPNHVGAWHTLAVQCGNRYLSMHTIDAMRDFLRPFNPDDTHIDDFEVTAKAMLRLYSGLDEVKIATSHANGVHGWRGRMAYELLAAVELLTTAAIQLLAHGDESYIREKLHRGLNRITGALYEGVRHSDSPRLYNFKSVYFPDERDR